MSEIIKKLGRLFIVGYPGAEPSEGFLEFIDEVKPGGIILFADNCESPRVISESIARIKSRYSNRIPFVAIDQEGGRVCRIKGAPAEIKAPAEYGRDDALERYVEDYRRSAVFMESLGINMNLAPVADIYTDENNTCLKDRCFGSDPATVTKFVNASLEVARSCGLLSCLKHFPGLGPAVNDPHNEIAVADYDMIQWEQQEMLPFMHGVAGGADLIMTTHLSLPKLDDNIVTGSRRIVTEMLRTILGFDGPVITDELTMKGAASLGDVGRRTIAAFNAGHDMLLFGQDFSAARQAYDAFLAAFHRGDVRQERIASALDRVHGIQYKLARSVLR